METASGGRKVDFETLPGTERKLGNPPLVCVPAGVFILSVCLMFPELNMCLLCWFAVCVSSQSFWKLAWYLQLSLRAVRTGGLWSADVLGRLSPHQGTPWEVGEQESPGGLQRLVKMDQVLFMKWKLTLLILLPACGGQERVECVWICWFLFCVFLCMCLELCENLEKQR